MLPGNSQSVQMLPSSSTNRVGFLPFTPSRHEDADVSFHKDVMQVAFHYFENGIAHFTRRINKSISIGCANGEIAPFVGHNAFLRWSALQDAAFIDPEDGKKKIWSESNVSEDFDMALRLQVIAFTKISVSGCLNSGLPAQRLHHSLGHIFERRFQRRCVLDCRR